MLCNQFHCFIFQISLLESRIDETDIKKLEAEGHVVQLKHQLTEISTELKLTTNHLKLAHKSSTDSTDEDDSTVSISVLIIFFIL